MSKSKFTVFLIPSIFVLAMWAVKIIEWELDTSFSHWGILPKTVEGIKGIIAAPLIHGDFNHLGNNSIPIFLLTVIVFYFYKKIASKILISSWIITGLWVWAFARDSYHIGASGVVYSLASFVFFSGILRKHYKLIAISLLVVFLYGSLIWGIFPLKVNVSWESHLLGGIAGAFLAFYYRKIGPQKPVYDWELEEDDDIEDVEFEEVLNPTTANINYIYKPKNSLENQNQHNDNMEH